MSDSPSDLPPSYQRPLPRGVQPPPRPVDSTAGQRIPPKGGSDTAPATSADPGQPAGWPITMAMPQPAEPTPAYQGGALEWAVADVSDHLPVEKESKFDPLTLIALAGLIFQVIKCWWDRHHASVPGPGQAGALLKQTATAVQDDPFVRAIVAHQAAVQLRLHAGGRQQIGAVAFSEMRQHMTETLLARAAAADPAMLDRLIPESLRQGAP